MKKRLLFIDRDGTLIEEPADEQIDSFEKLKFVKGAIRNLAFIREKLDFEFVMVSNQDGLGTDSFPEDSLSTRYSSTRTSQRTTRQPASPTQDSCRNTSTTLTTTSPTVT